MKLVKAVLSVAKYQKINWLICYLFGSGILKKNIIVFVSVILLLSMNLSSDNKFDSVFSNSEYVNSNDYNKAKYLINISINRLERLDLNVLKLLEKAKYIITANKYNNLSFDLYISYGLYWKHSAEYDLSVNYYLDALRLVKNKDELKTAMVYTKLGETYRKSGNLNEALKSLKQAESILINIPGTDVELAEVYNRISAVHFQLANTPIRKDSSAYLRSCLSYAQNSIQILNNKISYGIMIDNYLTIGACYRELFDTTEAMAYFRKAELICMTYPDSSFTVYHYPSLLINMSWLYLSVADIESALDCAFRLAKFNETNNITINDGYQFRLLSSIYEKMGDYKSALDYKKKELNFSKSNNDQIKMRILLELETKYNNQQIEEDLKKYEQIRYYQFLVIIAIVIFIIISFWLFISRHKALKKKQILIEKQNKELVNVNATKDKFFSILAHDLKNPIFGMSTLIEILHNDLSKDNFNDFKNNMELLKTNSKHVSELLEGLLTWARSQRGLIDFYPADVNVSYIVNHNIELLTPNAIYKSISIIDKTDNNHIVNADPNMFITIIRNILSNAIKFTPKNGTIEINSEKKGSFIEIAVKDSGIGMTEETQNNLFLLGKSSHRYGTNNETGTGLGLILCKEFIEKHNGNIWVDSEINKGSTFYFTLPIQE